MTDFPAIHRVVFLCTALALLPGCGVAAGSAPAGAQAGTSATAKPGPALAVQVRGASAFASGASARLSLDFVHARPGATLTVSYRPEPGLVLESAARNTLTADAQGRASDAPLLRGVRDGRHYLNVFVTQQGGDGPVRQVVSIPLTFGKVALHKKAASPSEGVETVTPSGEPLLVLPASPSRK
ncbi:hypothetical protein [Comamonas flocculans]|uniref:Uncharacterized protein n=1 Tax=Comamonas flocculans TaxID=2597701 RepID=A0A5B8RVR9_9BURK|nr:hypothetical protein [Comamonas flocculans]QEA13590.1 hypothetical protein FOZ74_11405 [Comamonas flocculans]